MYEVDFKEMCRLFWMVKGHLDSPDEVIRQCYPGYFKRMWYNYEDYVHTEGFEESWKKKIEKNENRGFTNPD
jgi:hypothetical protein